jgi:hypothetical protein
MDYPVYKIVVNEDDETGIEFVSLVDKPAIKKDFLLFQEFVEPGAKENKDEFISRCIPYMVGEGMEQEQAYAICISSWDSKFAEKSCPVATQDIALNLENRQKAIDVAHYGPLNPNLPNEEYWQAKADMFGDTVADAKQALCGNCSFFVVSESIKNCIAEGIGPEGGDPFNTIDAGELGYCEAFDFKCAARRTCDAWVVGGPITMERQSFQSYTDYPEAAKANAQRALDWAAENGWGPCGTPVGKVRANQLANGEAITRETIARMAGFERHRQNSDKELGDGCGRLMWLAWGGDEGVEWAQRKLQQIDMRQAYSVQDEEKRIISGPIMLANVPIYRYDDVRGEYYVTFPPDTIFSIIKKMARKGLYKAVNTDHANPVDEGVHMIELYLIDRERGVMPPKGYEDAEDGSAFASYLIDNDEIWTKVKAGEWRGFSVEGLFDMEQQDDIAVAMREIAAMLKNFAEEIK